MKSASKTIKTTCCYCGVGCGILASKDARGGLEVTGDPDHPVNQGKLCSKGRSLNHVAANMDDRILAPRLRRTRRETMAEVSMDTAIAHVANQFKSIIAEHGPDSVAMYVSGQCLTEEYYLANKLMKGFIGTNNIDTNSRLCMSSAVVGYKKALGDDLVPCSYEDIDFCDCFLVTGANPAWCHPILWRRVEQRLQASPAAKLIVVDPRRTDTCANADLHLQIIPGTDITLHNAIAALLIRRGSIDQEFLENHCEGFDELKRHLADFDITEAARVCGVPEDDLVLAAAWIGNSPTMMTMWTMGLNQSRVGTDKNLSLLNLSLLTGTIGKPGCGPFSLTGQPNAMGGREVGGMANLLAAHLDLANPEHREQVAAFWGGGPIAEQPGTTATEMVDALNDGRLKAVWIVCTNPAVSLPNLATFESAMAKAELVVVQEISERSDTLAYADVVLPAAGWLEKTGTMTNCERRISLLEPLLDPPGEALPDVEIFCAFAAHMGWGDSFNYAHPNEIYQEYTRLTCDTPVDVSGVSYERLRQETVQWPCPDAAHPGTPRLFTDHQFYTASHRARLFSVQGPTAAPVSPDYPFVLTTGRVRDQWHTRTKTGKVARLNLQYDRPFIEVNKEDAAELGLIAGASVEVSSAFGQAVVPCRPTDRIRRGLLFMPMHWGKTINGEAGRANNLTSSRIDPVSKQPDYKFVAVHLRPHGPVRKKVLVVGAGAAAHQFIQSYREHNAVDDLILFGREPRAFYNRILLPDYINHERSWKQLVTMDAETLMTLDVDFRCGLEVTGIDRDAKQVRFDGGSESYDKLVLCTGSRPFVPPSIPMDIEGMHTLRTRDDAEAILEEIEEDTRVLVVGGGLLGIEMAAALNHIEINCTVLERAPRLMERQLDETASAMLAEELGERGIEVICGESIGIMLRDEAVRGVVTDCSRHLYCDLVIVAVGTRPNIEVFTPSGLIAKRGLVVDAHLLTNDPDIYALGEIAEFEGNLFGITKAAQQQATVAAAHCAGDIWSVYQGSALFNVLKIHGRGVASAGMPSAPPDDPAYEELLFSDPRKRIYKKCVIHRDRLVGCIFIGDTSQFPDYLDLIESGLELDERRDTLLREGASLPEPPRGPIVCSCNRVGEQNLVDAIVDGATTVAQLSLTTRAGTGCGSCLPELRLLLKRELAETSSTTSNETQPV